MNKYKHVFFDLDRTLWDFETNSRQALRELFDEFKLGENYPLEAQEFVAKYKEINERMWSAYRKGNLSKAELRRERFNKTLKSFDINDNALGESLDKAYVSLSPYKTALVNGATETLEYLATKYSLHIITNGFEEVQYIKLNNSGIKHHFDVIVTSERASARKPSPEVFELAMLEANCKAFESIMIGDDLQSDILGAKAVWMDQIFYNPEGIDHDEDITHEIKHLEELRSIL